MKKYNKLIISSLIAIMLIFILGLGLDLYKMLFGGGFSEDVKATDVKTARVVAHGDLLYHDVLYMSALQEDGTYDFNQFFQYTKEWIENADLAIGDYEGTMSEGYEYSGYPTFNAPIESGQSMQDQGYDVVDLAHNHILDYGLSGAENTVNIFEELGLDTIGYYVDDRAEEDILIKEVNGIKIAILGYSYGYNGMEDTLTEEEISKHLSNLNEDRIKEEIEEAEERADVTIVMPQMGEEYRMEPTDDQVALYHKMVDWGADVIFGGHPHVPEPTETLEKDGEQKFIIYSMGNFISNQTFERMEQEWSERGVLMDVTFEKSGDKTIVKTVQAHPTLVWTQSRGEINSEGVELFDYRVLVLEDFIEGGKYRDEIPEEIQEKADKSYKEVNELLNVQWKN